MKSVKTTAIIVAILGTLLFAGACAKKRVAAVPPTPPPAPAAPTVSLSASPDVVTAGQPVTLTWNTSNATNVTISGLGTVTNSGTKQMTPSDSTTYELVATGMGGERRTSARVTVNQPVAQKQAPSPTDAELFERNIKDVYFDYDRYNIRADQANITESDAAFLNQHPNIPIVIEGHCDDRGSEEYNLALGDNRANAVKAELIKLGVNANRIRTISYGKEKPFCSEDNENCWSQNRRGHFGMKVD